VLAKQGKLPEARKHLQNAAVESNEERVQLTQAEAQLLRDASQYQAAFDVLGRALDKLPNYPDPALRPRHGLPRRSTGSTSWKGICAS
jgi:predicted Zn-dependent protease